MFSTVQVWYLTQATYVEVDEITNLNDSIE